MMNEVDAMREMLRALMAPQDPPPTLDEMRTRYEAWGLSNPLPEGAVVKAETLGGAPAFRIATPNARPDTALLYLHGGGYAIGSASGHRHLASMLAAAADLVAYPLDYRLAPEHPYPAAVDDAVAAYTALLTHGVDPQRIVVAGDSAGGGLTLALALALKDQGLPQPAGLFCISPWADLTQTGASYAALAHRDLIVSREALDQWSQIYATDRDRTAPLISPVYGDFSGLAPILIHVGADEILLSDSVRVAERAGIANVPVRLNIVPDMPHVWHFMPGVLTAARTAIAEAGAWMRERTT